jgi:hypothetical protein
MAKVKIKSNCRTKQTVVYYGGELTFDENGVSEIDENILSDALKIHSDLSIYLEGTEEEEVGDEELGLKNDVDLVQRILIHSDPNEEVKDITQGTHKIPEDLIRGAKEEVATQKPEEKETSYQEDLMAMERKDLVEIAIEAGFAEKELKPLNKTKLVEKILTKV